MRVTDQMHRLKPVLLNARIFAARDDSWAAKNVCFAAGAGHKKRWPTLSGVCGPAHCVTKCENLRVARRFLQPTKRAASQPGRPQKTMVCPTRACGTLTRFAAKARCVTRAGRPAAYSTNSSRRAMVQTRRKLSLRAWRVSRVSLPRRGGCGSPAHRYPAIPIQAVHPRQSFARSSSRSENRAGVRARHPVSPGRHSLQPVSSGSC
jgi:hypothetical protein